MLNHKFLTAGNATSSVLNSLVEAKAGIHEAAENFDSKSVISKTKKRIGNVIVQTFEGAGNMLEQAGVYDAIDSIVHGFAGVPFKVRIVLNRIDLSIFYSCYLYLLSRPINNFLG